jgi:hypothetical protein
VCKPMICLQPPRPARLGRRPQRCPSLVKEADEAPPPPPAAWSTMSSDTAEGDDYAGAPFIAASAAVNCAASSHKHSVGNRCVDTMPPPDPRPRGHLGSRQSEATDGLQRAAAHPCKAEGRSAGSHRTSGSDSLDVQEQVWLLESSVQCLDVLASMPSVPEQFQVTIPTGWTAE